MILCWSLLMVHHGLWQVEALDLVDHECDEILWMNVVVHGGRLAIWSTEHVIKCEENNKMLGPGIEPRSSHSQTHVLASYASLLSC